MKLSRASKIGLVLAAIHVAAFLAMAAYVNSMLDGQAPLLWVLWQVPDFPVGLLVLVIGKSLSQWADALQWRHPLLADLFYYPYLIHGFVGTIWWFLLPRFFMPRIRGGIWKTRTGESRLSI